MRQPGPDTATAIHPYFDRPLPRVLAHRGLAVGVSDNTKLAFVRALALGGGYIELDVHASSDGVAVVSHDADLARLVGRPERVEQLSFAELREIDLGDGQRFSSLFEILDTFPDARLNIDLKSAAAVGAAVADIVRARAVERVLVTSFSERRRKAAVRQLPGVATSASSIRFVLALISAKLRLPLVPGLALRGIHAVQVPISAAGLTIVTPRMVALLHRLNVEIHVWTINDRATMARLLDLGVDGLVTDRADIAADLVRERYPPRR
ncbi:MAG: glycerophosphodiester phosphodiesterase [Glaciihabitans sp.]|nr:glycerophosphodiester phosphodiesterase [Glaciihabitans sp.]